MEIFVYGSLCSGQWAHSYLSEAQFMGAATTKPLYELVDFGRYPGLLHNGNTVVSGEVYTVTQSTLNALDIFEGHPTLFERQDVTLTDGRTVIAYFANPTTAHSMPRIASGDWCQRN